MADFTIRFRLTVVCDLIGVPASEHDRAIAELMVIASTAEGQAVVGDLVTLR